MMSCNPSAPPNHPKYRKLTPSHLPVYSFDWSPHSAHFCSLAVGTFAAQSHREGTQNHLQLATLSDPQVKEFQLSPSAMLVDYPITKVQYSPHRVRLQLHVVPLTLT